MLPESACPQRGVQQRDLCSFPPQEAASVQGGLEVAHAGGEKTARGHVPARAGGRPLDDELGGHWHQIPTHREMGNRDRGWTGDAEAGLALQKVT